MKKNHVDLLLIREDKKHYVLIKYFNTFMHSHTLHRRRKKNSCYCLQTINTEEVLKRHCKD